MKRLSFNLERAWPFHEGRMSGMWLLLHQQPPVEYGFRFTTNRAWNVIPGVGAIDLDRIPVSLTADEK